MKYNDVKVLLNSEIASGIYKLELFAPEICASCRAGQFVNLYTGDNALLLPRPISICFTNNGTLTLVYRVVGKGTEVFAKLEPGDTLKALGPLGNGFPIIRDDKAALVGGGLGIPPLLELTRSLKRDNPEIEISAFLGYRNRETFLLEEFIALGAKTYVATDDGSVGVKGNVIDYIKDTMSTDINVYACGPRSMLKALAEVCMPTKVYISVEERMACGMGICHGCAVKVWDAGLNNWTYKSVCKDGPVFLASEIFF